MITCNGQVFGNTQDLWQTYKPKTGCVWFYITNCEIKEYIGEPLKAQYMIVDVEVKPKFYKSSEL